MFAQELILEVFEITHGCTIIKRYNPVGGLYAQAYKTTLESLEMAEYMKLAV
jgi:hypothetical protein